LQLARSLAYVNSKIEGALCFQKQLEEGTLFSKVRLGDSFRVQRFSVFDSSRWAAALECVDAAY
jgi:hypothetical protein